MKSRSMNVGAMPKSNSTPQNGLTILIFEGYGNSYPLVLQPQIMISQTKTAVSYKRQRVSIKTLIKPHPHLANASQQIKHQISLNGYIRVKLFGTHFLG